MADFTQTPLNPAPSQPSELSPMPHKMSRKVLIWAVVLAATLGIISVFLFFYGGSSFTESGVQFTLNGPNQVSVGDQVPYKIHIENNTSTALHNVKLSFTYPSNSAIVQNGQIVNNPGNVQTIDEGDLNPGAVKDEELDAFLVGDKGNIKVAVAVLNYNAGNIQSQFQKSAQLSTTISDVPVQMTLVAPPTTTTGQTVTYLLDYRNQSSDDISDLQLVVKYPDGFHFIKATPNASSGSTVWSLPLVKKGDGARITIQGTLSGNESDSKVMNVTLQRNINGTYIDYEKTSVSTVIASPLLNLNTIVNGAADYTSHAGDTLQYAINYKNASQFTFQGLTLTAKLTGAMYDYSSVDPHGGFYNPSTNTITWDSTAVSAFSSLQPNTGGTINFSIKLKQTPGSGSAGTLAHAIITLSTPNVPDTIVADSITTTNDVLTKITSQPTYSQKIYFSDPAFGSSGTMPPKAGSATSFTIHWLITNPGNALNNAKVVGTLPTGVTWKNVVSTGLGQPQPTFNRNTSQVVWTLGTLPAGAGTAGAAPYELAFQVSVTPSSTQVGQSIPVVTGQTLSGTDSQTGETIAATGNDLTTNSTVDQSGNGVVQ